MSNRSNVFRAGGVGDALAAHFMPSVDEIPGIASLNGKTLTTRQEIESARQHAKDEGFNIGYEDGRKQGIQKGYEDGYAAGAENAEKELSARHKAKLNEFSDALEVLLDKVQHSLADWAEHAEARATDLALEAVRGILQTELQTNREAALAITQEALREVTHSKKARIRVNPSDLPILELHREELLVAAASLESIELFSDPTIVGGCFIDTDGGLVDATVETKLRLLDEAMKEAS